MDNQAAYSSSHENKLNQLEEENKSLREEIMALRSSYQATMDRFEKQLALEKRYQISQQRFRTIFEQSKLGSKIIAPDLTIIQANKALQQMLGYSEKELEGTIITDYAHPDYKKHWIELRESLWTHKIASFQIDTCLFKKDGSTLWCSINTTLFSDDEGTLGYTTLEDITARKAMEEKFHKQAAMVNDDLENFIYTASHDLKSPVVNIEGLMISLTKKLTQKFSLDDEHNRMLSMIGASVDKLKSTIAHLTQIVKVQKDDTEDEIISIDKLVEEVYTDLGAITTQIPMKLHKHIEINEITFSRDKLRRILHTLLSNAIKYRSQQRTLQVHIKTGLQESCLVLAVEDNGMGIAENHFPRLFTIFKRFHTHVEGTGVGLYMIKRIVENAGGRIEAESSVEVGTTFKVYLPLGQ